MTDNVKQGKLTIEYCPSGDMVAYFFTKPLQDSVFCKLLKLIMNINNNKFDMSPQEYVGNTSAVGTTCDTDRQKHDRTSRSTHVGFKKENIHPEKFKLAKMQML